MGSSREPLGTEGSKCPFGSSDWAPSLDRLGSLLGSSWSFLGRLGAVWGCLGNFLEASWVVLVRSWWPLGRLGTSGSRQGENAQICQKP
eukprot:1824297-Pyramimonas_sp.AAC.1